MTRAIRGGSAGAAGSSAGSSAGSWRRRPFFPFWVLQATELVIAAVFVDLSIHVSGGEVLVGAGVACFALAVTAQGPLGIVRICGQSLHLVLAVVIGVVVAVAPAIPVLRPDLEGIIVLEFGALGLIRMATFTVSARGRSRSRLAWPGRPGRPGPPVIEATATVAPGPPVPPAPGTDLTPPSSPAAARRAGRATGAAAASARQAAVRYGPAVEATMHRTLRNAGRWVGRAAARRADPDPSDGPKAGDG